MKNKSKNIIMVLIALVAIISMIVTMFIAKNSLTTSNKSNEMQEMQNVGEPPEMPNGQEGNTPPEKPDSNVTNANGERPEMPNGQEGNTPPEKPDSDVTNDNGEGPEMPNGQEGMTPPDIPNSKKNNQEESSLTLPYYIAFATEGLVLSLSVVYLIMTKMNDKKLETKDKKIIFGLTSVILTTILTLGCVFITNNCLLTSESNNNQPSQIGGGTSTNVSYSSSTEITENKTIDGESYDSLTADENALSVTGDIEVNASNIEVTKTGDSDGGDNTSFYETNSAIIAKDGATLNLTNITVNTDATGANGVFSYGGSATTNNSSSDGTSINISDSTITTSKDNSGGIMTTGGGVMNASNVTITTAGTSSAAIRSDRGGGEVNVDGGTYKTTGKGSPTIYSTANITVKNAELVATSSEGVVIEGKNSVTLENVTLTDTNSSLNGQSTTYKNIFLYQSMSGDAANGNSEFTAKDSTITTNKGDTLYVTNTSSTITLENNTIINNDSTGNFLRAQKDSWGNNGSNGGSVTLNMINQQAIGNIVIDEISTLALNMKTNSYLEGTINGNNEAKSITLTIDSTSKIKLTGDSYVTTLNDEDNSYSNIDFNGYKLYVNGSAIN